MTSSNAGDFDWYIPPSDRFAYESQYPEDSQVTLKSLDPLWEQSRLSTAEFLGIWYVTLWKSYDLNE